MKAGVSHSLTKACASAAIRIFTPLVRMFLRHGIPYQAAAEWLRWCYVDVATREFKIPGRKQSKSRVAVITGLTRVDVDRLQKMPPPYKAQQYQEYQRAARVLTGWARDRGFQTSDGAPRRLPFEGASPNFSELVERFSGGTPPRAVLDELTRVRAVRRTSDGKLELISPQYVPMAGKDPLDQMDILGHAGGALVTTIAHNTDPACEETWLQGQAFNDRIPASALAAVATHIKQRGRELVFEIDDYLYQRARTAPADEEDTVEAGLGVYFFSNPPPAHGE